jgi:hypothetical protein
MCVIKQLHWTLIAPDLRKKRVDILIIVCNQIMNKTSSLPFYTFIYFSLIYQYYQVSRIVIIDDMYVYVSFLSFVRFFFPYLSLIKIRCQHIAKIWKRFKMPKGNTNALSSWFLRYKCECAAHEQSPLSTFIEAIWWHWRVTDYNEEYRICLKIRWKYLVLVISWWSTTDIIVLINLCLRNVFSLV